MVLKWFGVGLVCFGVVLGCFHGPYVNRMPTAYVLRTCYVPFVAMAYV